MKRFICLFLIIFMISSLCACGKVESDPDIGSDEVVSGEAKPAATELDLYKSEVKKIISAMRKNIDNSGELDFIMECSRCALVNCDNMGAKQLMMVYSPDCIELHAALFRTDKEGQLKKEDLVLTNMTGAATAEIRSGQYGGAPAVFVIFSDYTTEDISGSVYVYRLEDYGIECIYNTDYTGQVELDELNNDLLSTSGVTLCNFLPGGVGKRIDKLFS